MQGWLRGGQSPPPPTRRFPLRVDFLEGERQVGRGPSPPRLIGTAVDGKEEISLLHVLVVHDPQVQDGPAHLRRDPDDIGAYGGAVRARLHELQPIGVEPGEYGADDDENGERLADEPAD